jgi:hypothetical protein
MASKYEEEAQQEELGRKLLREWIQQRIGKIHERVTLHDVLRRNGVELEYEDRPTQFACPFHGKDNRPSARAYPESGTGPSHAWCFVCQERWDAISVWKKFNGGTDKKFTRILTEIEQAFGLDQPAFPDGLQSVSQEAVDAQAAEDDLEPFNKLASICERRLLEAKPVYATDMRGYLMAASLLERVTTRVLDRRMGQPEGEQRLRALLDSIGKRVRSCPAG